MAYKPSGLGCYGRGIWPLDLSAYGTTFWEGGVNNSIVVVVGVVVGVISWKIKGPSRWVGRKLF